MSGHPGALGRTDFSKTPFLVIWETTRSCALACKHCRASALFGRDPEELSTQEGKRVLDEAADMGVPIFILSGGDPLNRPDLEELVRHGKSRGLRMGTIPAATGNLTRARIQGLKDAGIDQIAFSIDGPTAQLHDSFRQVPGSFAKTLEGVGFVREAGVPLQINTCLAAWNFPLLEDLVKLVSSLGVVFWEVFFLIPTGRGKGLESLTAEQFEVVFDRLHRLNREQKFIIKLTEAPHYRRFVMQRERSVEQVRRVIARPRGVDGAIGMSPEAVNSGKGFLFIDFRGDICPSGFLPIPAGNVRRDPLAAVYRDHPLFQDLRDPSKLKGKCGLCEFASLCAGSRARAHAVSGDPFESDPYCSYQPRERGSQRDPQRQEGGSRYRSPAA